MMFKSLKLKTKIFSGFILVGLIATGMAVLSYIALDYTSASFKHFVIASEKAELGLVLARQVTEIQRQALIYTYDGHASAARQVHRLYSDMSTSIEQSSGYESPYIGKINKSMAAYMLAFKQLQTQRDLQNKLVHIDLIAASSAAAEHFQSHIKDASAQRRPEEHLQDALLLGTLLAIENNAMHYFDSLDPQYIARTKENFADLKNRASAIGDASPGNRHTQNIRESAEHIIEYERVFLEAVQRTRGYLFLVNVVMSAEAHEAMYNATRMSAEIGQQMDENKLEAFSLLSNITNSIVVAITISLLLVISLSLLIGRSITKPILGLTAAFAALAKGSYQTEIPAYGVDDEIGRLTLAANVFKLKNMETENLLSQTKKMAAELKESEAQYIDLYEHSPDMYCSVSADTALVITCNQTLANKLGYAKEEIIGHPIFDIYHPDCMPDVEKAFKVFITKGEVINRELQLKCKDGNRIDVILNVTAVRDDNGNIIHSRSSWRDISDRKQAEIKLRKLSQAVIQSGEAIAITDAQGCIEYVNPAFSAITGYAEHEALGQNPRILKSGTQSASFYKKMWSTLTKGHPWQGKVVNKKKSGEFYPAMLTISPIKNDTGEITNFIGLQQDLQPYEILEAQFHQAQKMEAIGTLVGGIAHNFNNDLAAIAGNIYLAKKRLADHPDVVQRLENVERISFSAAGTIQQLLTFSRKGIVQTHPLPLTSFLKETIKMQRASLPENISLEQQIGDADLHVNGDINQLQQVLMNLLTNAFDAVHEHDHPSICIRLERFHADAAFHKQHEEADEENYACISVTDNGTGIEDNQMEHIFEPFFTTKELGKGTGLGLAMVYGAVKMHGGVIDITSSPAGTSVKIYLPLLQSDQIAEMDEQHDEIEPGHGETILLVDDNAMVQETGRDLLNSLGYKVLTANDGLTAIEQYREHGNDIDMLLLDVVMPNLGGVEALQTIREINPKAKAVFATGYDKLRTQADDITEIIITKPFTVSKLSQAIRKTLEKDSN